MRQSKLVICFVFTIRMYNHTHFLIFWYNIFIVPRHLQSSYPVHSIEMSLQAARLDLSPHRADATGFPDRHPVRLNPSS